MGTALTKSIAARIPYDEYVRILGISSRMKMSMSDYLILRLDTADEVAPLRDQLGLMQNSLKSVRDELDRTKKILSEARQSSEHWMRLSTDRNTLLAIRETELEKARKESDKRYVELRSAREKIDRQELTIEQQNLSIVNYRMDIALQGSKISEAAMDRKGIISRAKAMYSSIVNESNDSTFNKIPKAYHQMLDKFMASLE